LGPLARLDLAEKLENQLQKIKQGAKIIVEEHEKIAIFNPH
jgi:hypothetical protein